jgi:hypothetical protein
MAGELPNVQDMFSLPVAQAIAAAEVCDATEDDSSNAAGPIKYFKRR